MYETGLLRVFVTVADTGGFTRASEILHSTQSTVSAQIRRLEEQVGQPLFVRSTRSVGLSAAGETLLGYARTILKINEDARQRLSGAVASGRVRLGSSEDLTGAWLPRLLKRYVARFPDVTIDLEIGIGPQLLRKLDDGELDVIVAGRCGEDADGWRLWREPLVWAYGRDSDWPGHVHLAFFPEPCPYRDAALRAFGAMGATKPAWTIACTCSSLAGVRAVAMAGIAATPLPRSLVGPELRVLAPEAAGLPPLPNMEYVASVGRRANSPAIAALMEMIQSAPGPVIASRASVQAVELQHALGALSGARHHLWPIGTPSSARATWRQKPRSPHLRLVTFLSGSQRDISIRRRHNIPSPH